MPKLSAKNKMYAVVAGTVGAIEVALFTYAILETTIASTLFFLFATSLVVGVVAGAAVFHEKITMQKVVAAMLAIVGIAIYTHGEGGGGAWTWGTAAALGSGVMYGLNNVIGKKLSGADALAAIQYKFIAGAGMMTAAVVLFGEVGVHTFSYTGLGVCLVFGGMLIAVNRLLLYGFKHTDVNTASVILSSELVFASLIGAVVYGELMSRTEVVGGMLILFGSVVAAWERRG
jgi:drug/metabolite transporter (DMT)-like permease